MLANTTPATSLPLPRGYTRPKIVGRELADAVSDWGHNRLEVFLARTARKDWNDTDRADYLHYMSTVDFTYNRPMTDREACAQVELDRSIDGFIG